MAEAIKEGIEEQGENAILKSVEEATLDDVKESKAVVLGSPAMGQEELAEEMDVFVKKIEEAGIKDKVVGVFGSYNWGNGEWLRDFVKRLKDDGFKVVDEGLKIQLSPDQQGLKMCREYGKMILEKLKS